MNKIILYIVTSMLIAMNVNAQTKELTSADVEVIHQRGCRVGTHNPHFVPRHSPLFQKGENPYIGNRHQLVVMASFKDRDFKEDHNATLAKWYKIFNAKNFNEDKYVGSIHDYFMAQSYGQFNLMFDLVFVELPDSCQKYRSTYSDDEYSQYMVDDIVDVLQTQNIDWSLYDWDGDAFVDQLLIVYAGEGMNATKEKNTIWPHQWWLSQHMNLETEDKYDFRSYRTVSSGDTEYYIDSYCCVQEHVDYADIHTSFGIICHEYTHCFGFPDFYYGNGTQVVGKWDLMDDGLYNEGAFHPCGYSANERMLMGWLTPVELTSDTIITDIPALCDEPVAYLVRNDGAENEYYIIENRQQSWWDEFLPGSGILVFHVEYVEDMWKGTDDAPNSLSVKRYSIFPANNKSRLSANSDWAYPYVTVDFEGNEMITNDELTNTSQPAAMLNNANVDGEMLMSKPITQMYVNDDGLASFVFSNRETTSIHQLLIDAQGNPSGIHQDNSWYMLDGRRLKGKPTTSGLYIYQGKKVFVHMFR